MSDDPSKKELDSKSISITQEHEVVYWTARFGCSKDELQQAVNTVGKSAAKVKEYLGK